ncbi:MAG: 30S ribosome-binding factor RbfA [Pyrinomonadaceae bacterium]|nr:30S ribosome-binding factor RbfA [Phycisphaerales bacterium]
MTHRPQQIASNLRQAIQQVLARGLHDPRIGGLVTITNVTVAADLKTATVFVSVLPEEKEKKTMFALRDAARHIRREVGELVAMRQVPLFTFKADSGLKREAEAYQAIAKIAREREEALGAGGTEGGAADGSAGEGAERPADSEPDDRRQGRDASSGGDGL